MAKNPAAGNCDGMLGAELGPQDIVSRSVAWRGSLEQVDSGEQLAWVGSEGQWLAQVGLVVQQQALVAFPVPSTILNLLVGLLMMTMLNPNSRTSIS